MQERPIDHFAAKVMQKIKNENLAPKKKSFLRLKQLSYYTISLLSLLVAAVCLGAWVAVVRDLDRETYLRFLNSSSLFFLLIVTGISVVSVAVTGFIALRNYRATRFGYRPRLLSVCAVVSVLLCAGGAIAYGTGAGGSLADMVAPNLPYWEDWEAQKQAVWMDPQNGRISGVIVQILDSEKLILKDFSGTLWTIDLSAAIVRPSVELLPGRKVKLLGQASQHDFLASELRPWKGHQRMGRHRLHERK